MRKGYRLLMFFAILFFIPCTAEAAAVRVNPSVPAEASVSAGQERLEKANEKLSRHRERYEKRLKRLERKVEKRNLSGVEDVWNDNKFRLGLLLLLVAIGLAIIGAIISLGGLFGFMAGLFALAGIILLIWSLVENYG